MRHPEDSCQRQMMRNALVPRIKPLAFERTLRDYGIPHEKMPLIEPLVGELLVAYAFDLPGHVMTANLANIARIGISPDEVHALAMRNLKARLPPIEYSASHGVFLAVTGRDLEACLLLADNVWEDAAVRFKRGFVVCAPRRDCLLVSEGDTAEAIAAIRHAARDIVAKQDDAHGLSMQLMSRAGRQWRLHAE